MAEQQPAGTDRDTKAPFAQVAGAEDEILRREYVTSTIGSGMVDLFRGLPNYVDDIERDFGNAIYAAMHNVPGFFAASLNLKAMILGDGIPILPSHEPPQDGGKVPEGYEGKFKKSVEVRDFCMWQLDAMETPLEVIADEMLDAMHLGNKAAEKIWAIDNMKNELVLNALKPKSRNRVAYVVDAFNNIVGILSILPGRGMELPSVVLSDSPQASMLGSNIIPREKFMILSHRKRNGDPRGNSMYRVGFNAYQVMLRFWPDYVKQGGQFGSPSLWGTTPESEQNKNLRDSLSGNTVLSGNVARQKTAQEKLADALELIRSGSCGAFPYGTEVNLIEMKGDGKFFPNGFEFLNREVFLACLGSHRMIMESQYGSRADSGTAQDAVGAVAQGGKVWLGSAIRTEILYWMVAYNLGEAVAREFTPRTALSKTAREDIPSTVKAFGAAGWRPTVNQWPAISQIIGLPPPDISSGYLESLHTGTEQDNSEDNKRPTTKEKASGKEKD
jgi:hypothetical protein